MVLGKGLDALIPDFEIMDDAARDYIQCDTDLIRPNRYQPRAKFSADELESLSLSIKEQGVIQPLIVRKIDDGYELVAGERRLRACRLAGLDRVPCIVKSITDEQLLEMSLVENIQRENLNPIEEAEAFGRMVNEHGYTQNKIATVIGKAKSTVAEIISLNRLPDEIKDEVRRAELPMVIKRKG